MKGWIKLIKMYCFGEIVKIIAKYINMVTSDIVRDLIGKETDRKLISQLSNCKKNIPFNSSVLRECDEKEMRRKIKKWISKTVNKKQVPIANLVGLVEEMRQLVRNQTLVGLMDSGKAEKICGSEDLSDVPDDLDVYTTIIWRMIFYTAWENNIATDIPIDTLGELFPGTRLKTSFDLPVVGRTDILEEITNIFNEGERCGENPCVVLSGEPGIGKSTIIRAYARQVNRKKEEAEGKYVIYLRCKATMKETILQLNLEPVGQRASNEEQYNHIVNVLGFFAEEILLVLDNADEIREDDHEFREICDGRFPVLIGTRANWMGRYASGFKLLEVGALTDESILTLFEAGQISQGGSGGVEDALVLELAEILYKNTLCIALASKLTVVTGKSIVQLIQEIRALDSVMVHDPERMVSNKDGLTKSRPYNAHLQLLVEQYTKLGAKERVLSFFGIFSGQGVEKTALKRWCKLKDLNEINELIDIGLLRQGEEVVSTHLLLRDVYQKKFPIDVMKDFSPMVKRMLEDDESSRGLLCLNMASIANRNMAWLFKEGEETLAQFFARTLEYGNLVEAKAILKAYKSKLESNQMHAGAYGQVQATFMESHLSLLDMEEENETGLRSLLASFEDIVRKCRAINSNQIRRAKLIRNCWLYMAEIYWILDDEEHCEDTLRKVKESSFPKGASVNAVEWNMELAEVMSQFPDDFARVNGLVEFVEKVRATPNSGNKKPKINLLKYNLVFVRILARGLPDTRISILECLNLGLQYGKNHRMELSHDYKTAYEAKQELLQIYSGLAPSEE